MIVRRFSIRFGDPIAVKTGDARMDTAPRVCVQRDSVLGTAVNVPSAFERPSDGDFSGRAILLSGAGHVLPSGVEKDE
jgi:hypothetical protein